MTLPGARRRSHQGLSAAAVGSHHLEQGFLRGEIHPQRHAGHVHGVPAEELLGSAGGEEHATVLRQNEQAVGLQRPRMLPQPFGEVVRLHRVADGSAQSARAQVGLGEEVAGSCVEGLFVHRAVVGPRHHDHGRGRTCRTRLSDEVDSAAIRQVPVEDMKVERLRLHEGPGLLQRGGARQVGLETRFLQRCAQEQRLQVVVFDVENSEHVNHLKNLGSRRGQHSRVGMRGCAHLTRGNDLA